MTDRTAPADPREALARAMLDNVEWDEGGGHCRYCGAYAFAHSSIKDQQEDHRPDCVVLLAEATLAARQDEPSLALRADLAAKVAEFMHGFTHAGYGPWNQSGGGTHRTFDTELAQGFLDALAANPPQTREAEGAAPDWDARADAFLATCDPSFRAAIFHRTPEAQRDAPVEGDPDFDATATDFRRGSPQHDPRGPEFAEVLRTEAPPTNKPWWLMDGDDWDAYASRVRMRLGVTRQDEPSPALRGRIAILEVTLREVIDEYEQGTLTRADIIEAANVLNMASDAARQDESSPALRSLERDIEGLLLTDDFGKTGTSHNNAINMALGVIRRALAANPPQTREAEEAACNCDWPGCQGQCHTGDSCPCHPQTREAEGAAPDWLIREAQTPEAQRDAVSPHDLRELDAVIADADMTNRVGKGDRFANLSRLNALRRVRAALERSKT